MNATTMRTSLLGLQSTFTSRSTAGFTPLRQNQHLVQRNNVPASASFASVRNLSQKQRAQQEAVTVNQKEAAAINRQDAQKHTLQDLTITNSSSTKAYNTASPDPLNAPTSTLPPPLDTPAKKEGENTAMFYLRKGLAYGRFYKTGIKNAAYVNVKLAHPVLRRYMHEGGLNAAMNMQWLTRSDLQLIRRRTYDFKRIPIIALIFAIAGEWTPFVVIGISGVVPYTCRVPHQVAGDRLKLEKRRETSFTTFLHLLSHGKKARTVDELTWPEKLHCSASLGLHSRVWPSSLGLRLPPGYMLTGRLRHHEKYLNLDDKLLVRDGGVGKLNDEELGLACVHRGLNTVDVDVATQRTKLTGWLNARHKKDKSCYELWLTPQ